MKLSRRKFLQLIAGLAALPTMPRTAWAQAYPTRPIRLVVPFPPGGAFDFVGRPWADKMKPLVGTVVIENIGGGGSSLGAAAVARANPDGAEAFLRDTSVRIDMNRDHLLLRTGEARAIALVAREYQPDVVIDARGGFKMVTAELLSKIQVAFQGQTVRSYDLNYTQGAFDKMLLASVTQRGANGTALGTHTFSYYDDMPQILKVSRDNVVVKSHKIPISIPGIGGFGGFGMITQDIPSAART